MNLFETLFQDLRYGGRALRRHPSFTIVSILALALGIGVNVAVFTLYKGFIARPLDARDPGTLVNLSLRLQSGAPDARFSYPDDEAYRDGLRSFNGVIAFSIEELTLTDAGDAGARWSTGSGSLIGRLGLLPSATNRETATTFIVSENYFPVLGVKTARGRAFETMSASELAASPPVLISENYWQRRFAGDPSVLGKSVRLNGAVFTIIGITPHNFTGTSIAVPNFWLPLSLYPLIHPHTSRLRDREDLCCRVFGRLAPGMSMHEAQAETTLLALRLGALHETNSNGTKPRAQLAGSLALPLTWAMLRVAVTKMAEQLPIEFILDVSPDISVFAYVLAISMLAGILFGLVPALATSRAALFAITRGTGTSLARGRLRHVLIAAQVAVSLTLMIAGGLLVRSASQALNMETGYDTERVISVSLHFPETAAYTTEYKASLVSDLRSRTTALPGVSAITSARAPDDNGGRRAAVSLNRDAPSPVNMRATLYYTWVQPNYFETLGIPLSRGRGFRALATEADHDAILSESAAHRLWPGQNPIGQSLRLGTDGQFHKQGELLPDGPTWQVIGVARDTRGVTLDGSDAQQVHLPLPGDRLQDYPLLVRTNADPRLLIGAVEPVITAVDPGLTATASTLQAMLRRTEAFLAASTSAAIASAISLFGMLLASMGIYSAVSYDVVLRTREVGIRMAIGAQKSNVLALMLLGSLRPVVFGLMSGTVLALGASRLLRGVLYGLSAIDTASFAGASLLFLVIAVAASYLPSRRAMRIDPLVALREQ